MELGSTGEGCYLSMYLDLGECCNEAMRNVKMEPSAVDCSAFSKYIIISRGG